MGGVLEQLRHSTSGGLQWRDKLYQVLVFLCQTRFVPRIDFGMDGLCDFRVIIIQSDIGQQVSFEFGGRKVVKQIVGLSYNFCPILVGIETISDTTADSE